MKHPGFIDFISAWLLSFAASFSVFAMLLILYNLPGLSTFKPLVIFLVIYGIVAATQSLLTEALLVSVFRAQNWDVTRLARPKAALAGSLAAAGPWAFFVLMPRSGFGFQVGKEVFVENGFITAIGLLRTAPEIIAIGLCGSIAALVFQYTVCKRLELR